MMNPSAELIKQGAEARVYLIPFEPIASKAIVKERFKKAYRHPVLDEKLTSKRVGMEARTMLKLRKSGIDAPIPYSVDLKNNLIYMEYIEGMSVRDYIVSTNLSSEMEQALADKIGTSLGKMHANNIIHGDLTTSNMVLRNMFPNSTQNTNTNTVPDYDVVLIDFGLSYISNLSEDKGVDLYVLERAFISTHPNSERMFDGVLEAYGKACGKNSKEILKRYEEVKMRGRKKIAFG